MIDQSRRLGILAAIVLAWQALALANAPAHAQEFSGNDLRDIRVGMTASELAKSDYIDFACAADTKHTLGSLENWHDCPADASGMRAIRFGFDPTTSRDGTMVAGHPAILTLLIADSGTVAGLQIETDPKARLYLRKKGFLLGIQAKSRYGSDGWQCTEGEAGAGEQPVGGVYLRERCTKTVSGRALVVERNLFRRPEQDIKDFVDETRVSILLAK